MSPAKLSWRHYPPNCLHPGASHKTAYHSGRSLRETPSPSPTKSAFPRRRFQSPASVWSHSPKKTVSLFGMRPSTGPRIAEQASVSVVEIELILSIRSHDIFYSALAPMFARYFNSLLPPLPPRRQLPVSERFYPEAVHCLALIPQVFISVLQIKFCSFFEIRFPKIP